MRKRLALLLTLLLFTLMAAVPTSGANLEIPPAPVADSTGPDEFSMMGGGGGGGNPGTIYYGAIPPNVDYNKPVLLFVHGKGSRAETWWGATAYHGTNDMYQYAYSNGYRTAFVDLHGDRDMWVNGHLLNTLIDTVRNYYGVSKVTIIAHSKGGVDSDAAVSHYGAASKVSRVITLGSPHWGTPLADLAYSNWAGWMADIFGARDDATYVMQTGYMDYFRSVTPQGSVPFRTLSGYKCGPVFSAMWYGCMAISGEDDGVVPVWSTRRPGGVHLREGHWDHDEIKMGSRTWSWFASQIQTASLDALVAMEGPLLATAGGPMAGGSAPSPETLGNVILRGDAFDGAITVPSIPLETGVRQATFTLFGSDPHMTATLVGPNGESYDIALDAEVPMDMPLGGLHVGSVLVTAPASGDWTLNLTADGKAGYLLITDLDSNLSAAIDLGPGISNPGTKRNVEVKVTGQQVSAMAAEGAVARGGSVHGRPTFAGQGANLRAVVEVPTGSGVHNLSVTVTGTLSDGTPFERSLVSSFAAVAPNERGTWR